MGFPETLEIPALHPSNWSQLVLEFQLKPWHYHCTAPIIVRNATEIRPNGRLLFLTLHLFAPR